MRKYEGTQDDYNKFDREDFIKHNPGLNFDEFMVHKKQFMITKNFEEYEFTNNLNLVQMEISQEDIVDDQHDYIDQWANIIQAKISGSKFSMKQHQDLKFKDRKK